jgi:hypothetical protein
MIRIYKQDNNGQVGVLTDCLDAEKFMEQLSEAVAKYMDKVSKDDAYSDQERDLAFLLPNAFEIMLKLKGYKNEGISEQRLLFAGDTMPATTEIPIVSV